MPELVYLDNAATTKPYSRAADIMDAAMRENWGNASSQHFVGKKAREALEDCRTRLARHIGAKPEEIYFTSGATESNNLAIEGVGMMELRENGAGYAITSSLEHAAVTKPMRALKRQGFDIGYVPAVRGNFSMERLEQLLREHPETRLVSIMAVQNEFGYVFPTAEIGRLLHELAPRAVYHVDAVQAFGKLPVNVDDWGCQMLTFCAHKIGGPKGIGALYVRQGTQLFSNALGGGQEGGLRSGTQALPQILAFACAADIIMEGRSRAYANACALKKMLLDAVCAARPDTIVNSLPSSSPFIVSFSIPETKNRPIMEELSRQGICISGASACSSNAQTVEPGTWRPKHPLSIQLAGIKKQLTESTYRVSFRDTSTAEEVQAFLNAFLPLVQR